jgi:hypothetical protein
MKHLVAGIVPAALLAAWLPVSGQDLAQFVQSGRLSDLRYPSISEVQDAVRRFYAPDYQLAWIRDGVPSAPAITAIRLLQNAALKGLDPEDHDAPLWSARVSRLRGGNPSEEDEARFGLALTVSMLRYAWDLHFGRANPRIYRSRFDGPESGLAVWLRSSFLPAADADTAVREIEPPFEAYRRTESPLARYIELAQADSGGVAGGEFAPAAWITICRRETPGRITAPVGRLAGGRRWAGRWHLWRISGGSGQEISGAPRTGCRRHTGTGDATRVKHAAAGSRTALGFGAGTLAMDSAQCSAAFDRCEFSGVPAARVGWFRSHGAGTDGCGGQGVWPSDAGFCERDHRARSLRLFSVRPGMCR